MLNSTITIYALMIRGEYDKIQDYPDRNPSDLFHIYHPSTPVSLRVSTICVHKSYI